MSDTNDGADGDSIPAVYAFWHWQMHWQVGLGISVGLFLGGLSGLYFSEAEAGSRLDLALYDLFGSLFMQALKMLIVPIVATSIVTAMAGVGRQAGFARMGGKTVLFYLASSLIAILIGLTLVNLIQPGAHVAISLDEASEAVARTGSVEEANLAKLREHTAGRGAGDMLHILKELVPVNIVASAARNQMLGIIMVSLLFGFFMAQLEGRRFEVMRDFWEGSYEVVMKMTFLVLRFLPLGVGCLIAKTAAETIASGHVLERLSQLALFAVTVLIALGLHAFLVMPLVLSLIARTNPLRHLGAMSPALLTAFSTASSGATLPLTMECVEHRAGVSKRVSSFVLPLGATINMDGTALYECVAVLFLAQLAGIHLSAADQFVVVVLALLTSIGVAGIPSASLVAIVIILNAVNLRLPAGQHIPEAALALVLIFDRLLDMCRTSVNVWGDSCAAVTIAHTEGETSPS